MEIPGLVCTTFAGGDAGPWEVLGMEMVKGAPIEKVLRLEIFENKPPTSLGARKWLFRGVGGHLRYTTREELEKLRAIQPILGRPEATRAALIPIKKSAAWWDLAQDERRTLLETSSKHIETGMKYLPAVARKLHHCRDLMTEPFDFLTWFEYAPADSDRFEELVATLRQTPEWKYVEREIDVRLTRLDRKG